MKVFLEVPHGMSQAMHRIARSLAYFRPSEVELVPEVHQADVHIIHVIGYPETLEAVARCREHGQRYAIAQYCFRSTQEPTVEKWLPIWRGANVVWSYYDLLGAALSEGQKTDFNFLLTPLGCDPAFRSQPIYRTFPRPYVIATSGYVAESETVKECHDAAEQCGRKVFHLGPELIDSPYFDARNGIPDMELVELYSRCQFVAGLRRAEGFEMGAVEGLMCGARPIVFDRPHYRQWFDGFAEFIPEADYATTVGELIKLFKQGPRPVSDTEKQAALNRFDWEKIAAWFWPNALRGTRG